MAGKILSYEHVVDDQNEKQKEVPAPYVNIPQHFLFWDFCGQLIKLPLST